MTCLQISSSLFRRRNCWRSLFATFLLVLALPALSAQPQPSWKILGPEGGDARAFAAVPGQPEHLYLGTINSWIYESTDEGAQWHRLARLGGGDGLILDNIVVDSVDPKTIYVAGWHADRNDGGLWISHDGGETWQEPPGLRGQSIRAFVQAPSEANVLFAGTLEGVFRSMDSGATWTQISPPGSREIHEIESLAVDPKNSEIVYAGTWHLPWKTTNGGKTWRNIKQGLIVDSDVFSMIIDPERPKIVYLSACSGIYKSESAGDLFHKIQGIPTEARRTRVLMQDPMNREIVYAGTTEGLYKTVNGGRSFRRMTGPDVVVNDVYVDPRDSKRVLLATDRGGVLASSDGGESFKQSNAGITQRKVEALLVDRGDPQRLYAGVVNDKRFGGVFVSDDGGANWRQIADGLDGRDIFTLSQTSDGTVLAGTSSGIFALGSGDRGNSADPDPPAKAAAGDPDPPVASPAGAVSDWAPRNLIANTVMKTVTEKASGMRVNVEKAEKQPPIELQSRVNALDASGDVWLAASSYGLLTSRDKGVSWQGGPVMGMGEYVSVAVHGEAMAAARNDGVVLSHDGGQTWWPMGLPKMLTRIHRILFTPDGTLWLGAREGVYFTRDMGKSWLWIERLPFRDVDDISYDAATRRILVSSRNSDQIFAIDPKTMTWKWWQTGFRVSLVRSAGNQLLAVSLNDGVVIGPKTDEAQTGQK